MPSRPSVWSRARWAGRACAARRRAARRGAARGGSSAVGSRLVTAAVDRDGELGCLGRGGEGVDQLDGVLRLGVDQVEGLAVVVGQVGEVVHRLGDVVDRDDVGVAEVDADQREPGRQGVAHPLEQREEVVGPVDLVHRAGLGVADHDRGPVDPPRHRGLLADDLLGLELGAVVRRGQPLALVEHRLVEQPAVVTGGGDRGDLVEDPGLERAGQRERRAGAADVQRLVELLAGGHVVDRGEVEEVLDRAAVLGDPLRVDAEPVGAQVADRPAPAGSCRPTWAISASSRAREPSRQSR